MPVEKAKLKKLLKYKYLYLLMLPGLVFYIIFCYTPMWGIVIAFQNYSPFQGVFKSEWVGLEHFKTLLTSPNFYELLRNTVLISSYKLIFGFSAPIILALLLNEVKNKVFKRFIQTVSYIPNFISWVIISGIVYALFNKYYGLLSTVIQSMGLNYVDISTDARYFRAFLVISHVWKTAGWGSIIYLAALSNIDPQLYEAADMDGANKWQRLLHITLPSIKNVIAIVFILSIGSLLNGDFEQIYLFVPTSTANNFTVANAQLLQVADIFETFVYRTGILQFDFSFPAAVGLFQSFFAMILILGTNWLAKKMDNEGIW